MEHIFSKWSILKKRLKGKFVYLFLDYDGTLAPIASTPEKAVLSNETREILQKLADMPNFKIAIISGRSMENVTRQVGLHNIVYVGNHGFEIKGPKINFTSPVTRRYKTVLPRIKKALNEKLGNIEGVFVEDKGLTLSAHFRLAKKKDIPLVQTIINETTIVHEVKSDVIVKRGKMVLEIRPPVKWDKGEASLWLIARQKFLLGLKQKKVIPICIGDDVTDEDMFRAVSPRGVTIFVGRRKKSAAAYFLRDTSEVYRFLKELVKC